MMITDGRFGTSELFMSVLAILHNSIYPSLHQTASLDRDQSSAPDMLLLFPPLDYELDALLMTYFEYKFHYNELIHDLIPIREIITSTCEA